MAGNRTFQAGWHFPATAIGEDPFLVLKLLMRHARHALTGSGSVLNKTCGDAATQLTFQGSEKSVKAPSTLMVKQTVGVLSDAGGQGGFSEAGTFTQMNKAERVPFGQQGRERAPGRGAHKCEGLELGRTRVVLQG